MGVSGKLAESFRRKVSEASSLQESSENSSDEGNDENLHDEESRTPSVIASSSRSTSSPDESQATVENSPRQTVKEDKPPKYQTLFISPIPERPCVVAFLEYLPKDAQHLPTVAWKGSGRQLYFKMEDFNTQVVRLVFKWAGFRETSGNSWNALWSKHLKPQEYRQLNEFQRVNHFPGTHELGRKDRLYANLGRMRRHFSLKEFDFLPRSFLLPAETKELEAYSLANPTAIFIMKPRASSRGRGIKIVSKIANLPKNKPCVVQRYISDPYLIDGYKFDLRLYVAVTSWDPLRLYLHRNGLARFCTDKYRAGNATVNKRFMHLTNYSVQKTRKNFVPNVDPERDDVGSKWSIHALWKYVEERGHDVGALREAIADLIVKTIISVEATVNTRVKMYVPHRGVCYELFGVDVLLDSHLKPYIMEVNTSPSLNINSPLDRKLKAHVMSDLFNMVGFVPYNRSKYKHELQEKRLARLMGMARRPPSATGLPERLRRLSVCNEGESGLANMSTEDLAILHETLDEFERRGDFDCIYPTPTSDRYQHFFEVKRYYNILISQYLRSCASPCA